jgi:hypothetical protein
VRKGVVAVVNVGFEDVLDVEPAEETVRVAQVYGDSTAGLMTRPRPEALSKPPHGQCDLESDVQRDNQMGAAGRTLAAVGRSRAAVPNLAQDGRTRVVAGSDESPGVRGKTASASATPEGLTHAGRHAPSLRPGDQARACRFPKCGSTETVGQCAACDEWVCARHVSFHGGLVRLYRREAGSP